MIMIRNLYRRSLTALCCTIQDLFSGMVRYFFSILITRDFFSLPEKSRDLRIYMSLNIGLHRNENVCYSFQDLFFQMQEALIKYTAYNTVHKISHIENNYVKVVDGKHFSKELEISEAARGKTKNIELNSMKTIPLLLKHHSVLNTTERSQYCLPLFF